MIENVVRHIYSLLVKRDYEKLVFISRGERLSADELSWVIEQYGQELVEYPDKIKLDIVHIEGSNPKAFAVTAPIYTSTEGISDLSLELQLVENGGVYRVQIDDVRVL